MLFNFKYRLVKLIETIPLLQIFIYNHLEKFKHRTFNGFDLHYFILRIQDIYKNHGGLEKIFTDGFKINNKSDQAINYFRNYFIPKKYKEIRTKKNELMCFLTVTSEQPYDVTVFSDTYIQYSQKLNDSISKYVLCQVSMNNEKLVLKRM